MTIMAVAVAATLRSFSQSMAAIRLMEVKTKAQIFAQQLLEEYELDPPAEGTYEGGFGDDYREYTYVVEVQYEEQKYKTRARSSDVDKYIPMRLVRIDVNYDNGVQLPTTAATVRSAVVGFERYTAEARRQLQEY